MSLLVTPKLNMSMLLPQKRVGLHTFFLPAFFTLYKVPQENCDLTDASLQLQCPSDKIGNSVASSNLLGLR